MLWRKSALNGPTPMIQIFYIWFQVAGTEEGVKEPQATFSACFGAAFIMLHPTRYAAMLAEKMQKHGATGWLVNTGWSGGRYDQRIWQDIAAIEKKTFPFLARKAELVLPFITDMVWEVVSSYPTHGKLSMPYTLAAS